MNYLKGSHYQLACGSYFTATHSKVMDSGDTAPQISHPNGYFEESQRLHSGLKSQGEHLSELLARSFVQLIYTMVIEYIDRYLVNTWIEKIL